MPPPCPVPDSGLITYKTKGAFRLKSLLRWATTVNLVIGSCVLNWTFTGKPDSPQRPTATNKKLCNDTRKLTSSMSLIGRGVGHVLALLRFRFGSGVLWPCTGTVVQCMCSLRNLSSWGCISVGGTAQFNVRQIKGIRFPPTWLEDVRIPANYIVST
jgi:hypothetical protein